MPQPSTGFGEELRKRRLEAGLSLTALSGSVHYSTTQLSKVERGLKAPSRDLARLHDAALGAGGALMRSSSLRYLSRSPKRASHRCPTGGTRHISRRSRTDLRRAGPPTAVR
ncbi:helix-turn-helix domain-containing protein [Streptomyces sp. WSLK1-3]|uniref:helix-turn-helix domain-containing protein n=1 Tax=Streptomyces sp. WSLK1-3 TaxID=3375475 RepID=UPI0037BA311D